MEFNASRITSITFWGCWILDQKGLGHAGPLGSARTPLSITFFPALFSGTTKW